MPHKWDPLWADPEATDNAEYVASIRRMIIASINWMESHPDANPAWREPNRRQLARDFGISDDVPIETIAFTGDWERFYNPQNEDAKSWFRAMVNACEALGGRENAPSAWMFGKAVACGLLFKSDGWEEFNKMMLALHADEPGH